MNAANGQLSLLQGVAHAQPGSGAPSRGPVDAAMSRDGHYLYPLYSGLGLVGAYSIGGNGSRTALASTGLPAFGTEGLVAL